MYWSITAAYFLFRRLQYFSVDGAGSFHKKRIDNPYVIRRIEATSLDLCIAIFEFLAENINIDKSKVDD